MIKFSIIHKNRELLIRLNLKTFIAQIWDGKQWLACGNASPFKNANQAIAWLKIYVATGETWQAVNRANLDIFGIGEIAA